MTDYFIKDRQKNHISKSNLIRIIAAFVFLILGAVSLWFIYTDFWLSSDWKGYTITKSPFGYFLLSSLVSLGPELAGIAIGVILIDFLNEKRQSKELQKQLLRQMSSKHNDVADAAINELAYYGWLVDGSMKNVNLLHAALESSNLYRANLAGSYIIDTNLKYAVLNEANLSNTHILGVSIEGAGLQDAKLSNAYLKVVNLKGSNLRNADFRGARLEAVDLKNANLSHVDMEGTSCIGLLVKGADFFEANLPSLKLSYIDFRDAILEGANLEGSDLRHSNLSHLSLIETNLGHTNLQDANLENADLDTTNLRGANLTNAKVTIEQLHQAFLNHETIMPNGSQFIPSDYPDWPWRDYDW